MNNISAGHITMPDHIPFPKAYENKSHGLGRVVEGFTDSKRDTGRFYEVDYNQIRSALEAVRERSHALFLATIRHLKGEKDLLPDDRKTVAGILSGRGVSLESENTRLVAADWGRNSPQLDKAYQPRFALDVGRPVSRQFYLDAAESVDGIRKNHPHFAAQVDSLLQSGDITNLKYPKDWLKGQDGLVQPTTLNQFARAVSAISLIQFEAAGTYAKLNPAPHYNELENDSI